MQLFCQILAVAFWMTYALNELYSAAKKEHKEVFVLVALFYLAIFSVFAEAGTFTLLLQ